MELFRATQQPERCRAERSCGGTFSAATAKPCRHIVADGKRDLPMPLLRTSPTARTGAFTLLVEALTQIVETDDEARDKAIAKPRIEVRTATQHSA
jgi:hypothetical protein